MGTYYPDLESDPGTQFLVQIASVKWNDYYTCGLLKIQL